MWQRNNSEDHVLTSVNKLLLLLLLLLDHLIANLLSVKTNWAINDIKVFFSSDCRIQERTLFVT